MGLRRHNLTLPCWLGLLWLCPACADNIYVYTGDDGTVYLSNVPADSNYRALLAAPKEPRKPEETPAPRADQPCAKPPCPLQYNRIIQAAAQANGLDSALLHAVISVESRYNPNAVSKKGAVGLMQLMPTTASHYGVVDLYDPAQNIQGGAKYLRDLLSLFNGDLNLALAAYNAGEPAVARYGNRIPPFRETSDYVPRVLTFYRKYRQNPLD